MHFPWIMAGLAGLAVVLSSTLARHARGPWAGVIAAAPITPTFSLLLIGDGRPMLDGIPLVAWTLVAILLVMLVRHPLVAAIPGVAVLALVVLPAPWRTAEWVVLAVLVAAGVRLLPPARQTQARARMPWWIRFAIGAGAILIVAAVKQTWPAVAGWVAMAPWLFIAATVAAACDGGWSAAARVLHGGVGGALGVISFALVVGFYSGAAALPLAWLAFAATAVLWSSWRVQDASTGLLAVAVR